MKQYFVAFDCAPLDVLLGYAEELKGCEVVVSLEPSASGHLLCVYGNVPESWDFCNEEDYDNDLAAANVFDGESKYEELKESWDLMYGE